MKKNVLFIYRGQVLLDEFLPEYEKHMGQNCVLLVEKGIPFNLVNMTIKRLKLSVELKTIDDLLENNINMKFDSIVMNPPYKNGLHYKLLNRAFDLLNEGGTITCIHPATAFLNKKTTKKQKEPTKTIEIVEKYRTELELIDGNKIFNAGLFVPLSITKITKVIDNDIRVNFKHLDKNSKYTKTVKNLDNIFIHADDRVLSIIDKVKTHMISSVEENLYRNGKNGDYYLTINKMAGNTPKEGKVNPDFYCMIYKKYENNIESLIVTVPKEDWERKGGSQFNQIAINSVEEGKNVAKYLMTKFARFCLSILKISSYIDCGELDMVPFMEPTVNWDDETLYQYFNLTEDEIIFINEYIGNWYGRDFS